MKIIFTTVFIELAHWNTLKLFRYLELKNEFTLRSVPPFLHSPLSRKKNFRKKKIDVSARNLQVRLTLRVPHSALTSIFFADSFYSCDELRRKKRLLVVWNDFNRAPGPKYLYYWFTISISLYIFLPLDYQKVKVALNCMHRFLCSLTRGDNSIC